MSDELPVLDPLEHWDGANDWDAVTMKIDEMQRKLDAIREELLTAENAESAEGGA